MATKRVQDPVKTAFYRHRNIDAVRERDRSYRAKHREKYNEYLREYYKSNKEKLRSSMKKWRQENKEIIKVYKQNRRAKERAGKLSKDICQKLFAYQKGKCVACIRPLPDDYHIDHIMPLSRGGKNEDTNVQLLCGFCNSSKHALHPVEFMQRIGYLL